MLALAERNQSLTPQEESYIATVLMGVGTKDSARQPELIVAHSPQAL